MEDWQVILGVVCIGVILLVGLMIFALFLRARGAEDRVIKWWIESEEKEKSNDKTA